MPLRGNRTEGNANLTKSPHDSTSTIETPKSLSRPEQCEIWGYRVACDVCASRTTQHHFHCSICISGDYNLCPKCVSHGAHCLDNAHYLPQNCRRTDRAKILYKCARKWSARYHISLGSCILGVTSWFQALQSIESWNRWRQHSNNIEMEAFIPPLRLERTLQRFAHSCVHDP